MASIDTLIAKQTEIINSTLSSARSLAGRISNVYPATVSNRSLDYKVVQPAISKPPSFGDVLPSDTSAQTVAFLDGEADKWLNRYFPELQSCLRDKPEQWICGILSGQDPFGDSQAVFDAIWHQGRDQAYRERTSAARQMRAEFSLRGFTLPPGAMAESMQALEESTSDAIAAVNKEQMLKVAEIKLALIKFAAEQAISLKQGIMGALANFYRMWIEVPNQGLEQSRVRAQAYSALQGALSSYYNVELGFEGLRLRAAETNLQGQLDSDRNRLAATPRNEAAGALGSAVRAFGDVAAAAATGQSALVADLTGGSA